MKWYHTSHIGLFFDKIDLFLITLDKILIKRSEMLIKRSIISMIKLPWSTGERTRSETGRSMVKILAEDEFFLSDSQSISSSLASDGTTQLA